MRKVIIFITVILSLHSTSPLAQTLTINDLVTITTDTLSVYGTVTISPVGHYQNHAGIVIATDSISCHGLFTSHGTEITSSVYNQVICGNFLAGSHFGKLIKNNQDTLFLQTTIHTDSLIFKSNGIIALTDSMQLVISSGSYSSIIGTNEFNYIQLDSGSRLVRLITDTLLNHDYLFPVGSSVKGYAPISLSLKSLGATGPNYVGVQINPHLPEPFSYYRPLPNCTASQFLPITLDCLDDFYWTFTGPNDYKYLLATSVQSTCSLSPYRIITTPTTYSDWNAMVENTSNTPANDLCDFTTWNDYQGVIHGGIYTGLMVHAIIAGNIGSVLPVTLTHFTGYALTPKTIQLHWETISEINNDRFSITRSIDGYSFDAIGELPGNGTSTQPHTYEYLDSNVLPNTTYYYQLIQQDHDGAFEKSNIVSVKTSSTNLPAIVTISNTIGQIIDEYELLYYDPNDQLILPNQSGIYLATVTQGFMRTTRRVMVMSY